MTEDDGRPPWDEEQAYALLGMRVLIGITRVLFEGHQHEQMFGVVLTADSQRGIEVRLEGSRAGETYWLPPELRAFSAARAGEYRLKSTGETVIDPDYITTWTIDPTKQ